MKLKKFFAVLTAAAALAVCSLTAFALEDGQAAYCFDTADKLSDWQTYGSVSETGFAFKQTTANSKNGEGCIAVSEKFTGEVSDTYGGAYVSASTFGLPDFGGCTISMSVLLNPEAEDYIENFSLYSDGMIWLETPVVGINSQTWTEFTLTVPANAENSQVGFTIPTFSPYSGEIVYIDDFSIVQADGTLIANTGDYKAKTASSAETVSTGTNIILTVVLVVLILAIVAGIGVIVSSVIKKFA
ncbi:MAG: hypothetical protein NC253_08030 [Ruminococcus sp.]|nr:hypothetical protein [Ruminococcus sp.]MCM1380645.1 hypothetical protein [Muribaculaceae bacterium]MCM1478179.1 hypothetical protein [Muribaculaceae bacterium]